MFWKLRYWWACASGSIRRAFGLSRPKSRTLSEVMYDLEQDPTLRKLIRETRKEMNAKGKPE